MFYNLWSHLLFDDLACPASQVGSQALRTAVSGGYLGFAQFLLKRGAPLDAPDKVQISLDCCPSATVQTNKLMTLPCMSLYSIVWYIMLWRSIAQYSTSAIRWCSTHYMRKSASRFRLFSHQVPRD